MLPDKKPAATPAAANPMEKLTTLKQAALLAGGNNDFLPTRHPLRRPLAVQPDYAALAEYGADFADAQFDAFLQGKIHPFAAGNSLYQCNVQRRLVARLFFTQDGLSARIRASASRLPMCSSTAG